MNNRGLSRLETLVQEMVEGSFGRLLGGQLAPQDVAARLVWALEDSMARGEAAPAYEVALNPVDLAALAAQDAALDEALAEAAWRLGRQAGLALAARPQIRVVGDTAVRRHSVQIRPRPAPLEASQPLDATQVVGRAGAGATAQALLQAQDAFLIVQGRRHFALDKPLVTLGRRADNDIVLDLPSVSRRHAQIRWRFGEFVLYDVGNRGRTSVNGVAVHEHALRPGDVIALSEATLIYGEGRGLSDTGEALGEGTRTQPRP
jgi:hypothetical protein